MPTDDHEILVALFRERPTLLLTLLERALGISAPSFAEARLEPSAFSETKTTSYWADLAVTLRDADGRPVMALVGEIQRQEDEDKRFAWPRYWTSLHAELRCLTCLIVVTLEERVARWASEPIPTLLPAVAPLVIGPRGIPWLRSVDEARAAPELAMLSARAHGDEPGGVDVLAAALAALAGLDEDRARLYFDWLWFYLGTAARAALEMVMEQGKHEYRSDFARKYVAEGVAEGLVKGKAESVLAVLATRGILVDDAARSRILGCADLAVLQRWLERAVTAGSAAEVLEE